jgi:hypothetical protein
MQIGRTLLLLGLALVVVGGLWMLAEKLGIGRLPGDLVFERKNVRVYIPLVSSLVISVVLTLLFNLFRR